MVLFFSGSEGGKVAVAGDWLARKVEVGEEYLTEVEEVG